MMAEQQRPAHILLVEDNPNDVELTRQGFKAAELPVTFHHVENGRECLRYLNKVDDYSDAPTPDLILLDLDMPVMDGREVLGKLVGDDQLRHLPVTILTTSSDRNDVLDLYRRRCNSYLVKPLDFERFIQQIRDLCAYWFSVAALPETDRAQSS